MEDVLINGPINVVRMEGYVGKIKKIAYFFLDYHISLQYQTKCASFLSLDLYQYFANNLKNVDFPIDFMFEITQSYITTETNNFKDIYIREVVDFFNSQYLNKRKGSKQNIRYHYIDIRDYMYITIDQYNHKLDILFDKMSDNNYLDNKTISEVKENLNKLMAEINYWEKVIFGDFDDIKNNTLKNLKRLTNDKNLIKLKKKGVDVQTNIKKVPRFIYKIREKYNNTKIRDNLQDIFNIIKSQIKDVNTLATNIINIFDKCKHLLIDDYKLQYDNYLETYTWFPSISETIDVIRTSLINYKKLFNVVLKLFTNLMDIYFLRRFLDKDYIQHAVIYTGCAHSINYIQHLLTKYDFKITHVSYSLEKNLNKLNDHLKKYKNISDRNEFEKYLYIPELIQCSNISHFPKNFE